ncbi:SET domain [Cinara cedri]|uniref:SET domain n=1 Tax=Cinara cedri TaxID=506608 RepID=A0A5E4MTJ1_9HEMI|nr:SET domain [Cinara cedri]
MAPYGMRYELSERFPNEKGYGVKVVCAKRINKKQEIKALAGQCYDIEQSDTRPGVNDFSLLYSNRTQKQQMMYLGPAAYVNHDCESNCSWSTFISKSYVHLVSNKNINPGEELTTYYGDNFFGENNCLLELMDIHQTKQTSSNSTSDSDSDSTDTDGVLNFFNFLHLTFNSSTDEDTLKYKSDKSNEYFQLLVSSSPISPQPIQLQMQLLSQNI